MNSIVVLKSFPDSIMHEIDFMENELYLTICGEVKTFEQKEKTPMN
jgi:hypothetical protein